MQNKSDIPRIVRHAHISDYQSPPHLALFLDDVDSPGVTCEAFLSWMEVLRRAMGEIPTGGHAVAVELEGVSADPDPAATAAISRRWLQRVLGSLPQVASEPTPIYLREAVGQVRKLTPDLIVHLKRHERDIAKIPPDVFEHLIAEFLAGRGFATVRMVGHDAETAADIFALERSPSTGVALRYFIEVKRWKGKVGVEVVDRVYGAMVTERPKWGWHVAMICSLSGFKDFRKYTPKSLRLMGVELCGGEDILEWLRAYHFSGRGLLLPRRVASEPVDPGEVV